MIQIGVTECAKVSRLWLATKQHEATAQIIVYTATDKHVPHMLNALVIQRSHFNLVEQGLVVKLEV